MQHVVDSNFWWAWQWLLFIRTQSVKYGEILRRILEGSDDSDDGSNLSYDFDEILLVWTHFRLKFPFISKTVRYRH